MTNPAANGTSLAEIAGRIRAEAAAAGELVTAPTPSLGGRLDREAREFILGILDDGTYAAAAEEVSSRDPDLANE